MYVINEQTKIVNIWADTEINRKRLLSGKYGVVEYRGEVEQGYDGTTYAKGYAPVKPVETMQAEVRAVRNGYLEKYVDPKQLVMVWDSLSADDKKLYADYRTYLLDYTGVEDWYLKNPMTLDEWKQSVEEIGEDKESEDLTYE